jgi:putative DNA primase/helicase
VRPSLAPIVRALGGELYADGRRANVPGPGHGSGDRSVSLLLAGRRVIVHSFAEDPWREVLAELRRLGLVDHQGLLVGQSGSAGPAAQAPPPSERRARAVELWTLAGRAAGSLSERHLRRRAVARPLSDALRHHPAAPVSVYRPRGGFVRPALVARIQAPTGETCAVEITYLGPDGDRARLRLPRKTVGVLPPGSAVRLDPVASAIVVAEGVFSALSASERFARPAWALLSAANLAAWTPPAGVHHVLIAADRGRAGELSAARLARRLRAAGVGCHVALPPEPFGDWNEVAQASSAVTSSPTVTSALGSPSRCGRLDRPRRNPGSHRYPGPAGSGS